MVAVAWVPQIRRLDYHAPLQDVQVARVGVVVVRQSDRSLVMSLYVLLLLIFTYTA